MDLECLTTLERDLRAQCEALDPDAVPLPAVVPLFGKLEQMARLVAGAKLRLVRKLDEAGAAHANGARSTADFVSNATGTTVGAAQDALDTSKRLADQPDTDEALAKGELSDEQARAVSDAAAADPKAERKLLDTAKRRSVRDLKKTCAETKANAHPDPAARRDAIRRSRSCRTWTGDDGAWNLAMRHLPEVGAEIEKLLAPYTHARHEAARQAGTHESREAYRADALLDLARASRSTTAAPKGGARADTKLFVHIDLDTLLAGRTTPGSICRIDGIGPVDLAWVRSILGDAFVVALLHDTVDVRSVVHLGRQVTAHQRSAMEARGHHCEVPGCDATWGLEIDHITGWSVTGTTTLNDLAWLCGHHHDQKTHRGHTLTGPPGARHWNPPHATTRPQRPPPPDPGPAPPVEPALFADPSAA